MAGKTATLQRTKKRWTIEDWLNLPEGPPFYELEDGRLVEMLSPRREHQEIVGVLYFVLRQFVWERNLGTVIMAVDVILPTGRGYIPDLVFVRRERESDLLAPDGKVHGAPDLVVEVISPTTRIRDRVKKVKGYFEAGVEWIWLIDSDDMTVEEFKRTPEGYLLTTSAGPNETFEPYCFKGLKLNLSELVGRASERPNLKRKKRS